MLAQMQTQSREKYRWRRGFQNIIAGAHLRGEDMVHIAVERSQQDNRPLPLPAQIATERHSVLAGQHNVQQHQIRFLPRDHLLSAVAARLDHHIHIMLAEIGGDQRAYLRVILNKNDFIHVYCTSVKEVTYTALILPAITLL